MQEREGKGTDRAPGEVSAHQLGVTPISRLLPGLLQQKGEHQNSYKAKQIQDWKYQRRGDPESIH